MFNPDIVAEVLEDMEAVTDVSINEALPALATVGLTIGAGILIDKAARKVGEIAGRKAAERAVKTMAMKQYANRVRAMNSNVVGNPQFATSVPKP